MNVLIWSQVLHKKLLSRLCAYHIYLIFCLFKEHSYFAAYRPLSLDVLQIRHIKYVIKTFQKNSWKIKKIFKIKEFNEIILEKGFFSLIKMELCLTKEHVVNQGVKIEYPFIRICFWYFWFKLRKTFFSKRALFNEAFDLWTLYFSKIVPDTVVILSSFTRKKFQKVSVRLIFNWLQI